MVNSKRKGKTGELEFSKFCREHGYKVRRTQQFCGKTEESADCIGLPGIHIEVKRYKTITYNLILKFLSQALRECKLPNRAIVAYKEDYGKWYVVMKVQDFTAMFGDKEADYEGTELLPVILLADDWFRLYREWEVS